MANITINSLPTASTIDATQDILPIYTASGAATQGINRNTLLGLASAPVGLTDSQTLTSKILTAPTINGATFSGTLSGTYTIGGTPTFPASVVTLTGSQTLTNKVLTSPTISSPTITNATISADTITGFTSANNGTLYGISITGSQISSALTLTNGLTISAGGLSVTGTLTLPNNSIAAANLATSAITLNQTPITSNFTTSSATAVQITGLTATVTIPAGGRKVRITGYVPRVLTGGITTAVVSIWDGVVGSGTQIGEARNSTSGGAGYANPVATAIVTPAAGSKTYNIGLSSSAASSITAEAAATYPSYILVEVI